MSYQWGPTGPAFEFRGLFSDENRLLLLRALLAAGLALVLLVVVEADLGAVWGPVGRRLQRAGDTLHLWMVFLLMVVAIADAWRALRQRVLRMLPGDPAPLVAPMSRPGADTGPGAAAMRSLLEGGAAPVREIEGPYQAMLVRLAPTLGAAPVSLQLWLERRLAHLLLLSASLLLLLPGLLLMPAGGAALLALAVGAVAAWRLLRAHFGQPPVPRPRTVLLQVAAVAVTGVLLGLWLGPRVGGDLARVGLGAGVAVGLLALVAIEALAVGAARVAVDPPFGGGVKPVPVQLDIAAPRDSVLQEVERELHRYWIEGVPNRRYAWTTDTVAPAGGRAVAFEAIEETQPTPVAGGDGPGRALRRRLLVLLVAGPLLTLVSGVLWALCLVAIVRLSAAPWVTAGAAVTLLLAGSHALRIGHLLWGRIEAESRLLALQVSTPDPGDAGPTRLQWAVAQVGSVFYAGVEHEIGNRSLRWLRDETGVARRSVDSVRSFALAAADSAPPMRIPVPARTPAAAPTPPSPRLRRFCIECGKPVVPGARFCAACGAAQPEL